MDVRDRVMSALDRSWLRRSLVSPPHFGRTLPELWTDVTLTFSRETVTRDPVTGEFQGHSEAPYLVTRGHARRRTNMGGPLTSPTEALVRTRRIDLRIPYPPAVDDVPILGDVCEYATETGRILRLRVVDASSPRGWTDHVHVICEEQG